MKPAVPKYLEHTAFGAHAKQRHPGLFSDNDSASTGLAQMLPQRLIWRPSALAPEGVVKHMGPVVETGDRKCHYIADAPFARGCSAVYFEVQVEAISGEAAGSVSVVDIGVEKRDISRRGDQVDMLVREHSSEELDDTSDLEVEVSRGSDTNVSLTELELAQTELLDVGDDEGLAADEASAMVNTLDERPVWNWVWKSVIGVQVSTVEKPLLHSHSDQITEPFAAPLALPVRLGFCLDLASNRVVLTRDGCIVASRSVARDRPQCNANQLGPQDVLVPIVTIQNARVRPVFGDGRLPNDGFSFDIAEYCRRQFSMPKLCRSVSDADTEYMLSLVTEYIAFYGYTKTADAYVRLKRRDLPASAGSAESRRWRAVRGRIREHIHEGNIDAVYKLLAEAGVKKLSPDLEFKLDFHAFVQLVRTSSNVQRVLDEGRVLFSRYKADTDEGVRAKLEQASGLLVLNDPHNPSHRALYGPEAVGELTTAVLSAVSEAEGSSQLPTLSKMLSETCSSLLTLARRGNGTASAMAAKLSEQAGWHY